MRKPRSPVPPTGDNLESLRAVSASLGAQIEKLQIQKNHIDAAIEVAAPSPLQRVKDTRPSFARIKARLKASTVSVTFKGLSLAEGSIKCLEISGKGNGRTAKEIWGMLSAEGFEAAAENPEHAVQWALRKRQRLHHDVTLIRAGTWGLTKWYTSEELLNFKRALDGMAGREKKNHSEKTRLGMAISQRRGVRLGAPTKMTPENIAKAEEMLRAQRSVKEVATELGVSKPSIYAHFKMTRENGVTFIERKKSIDQMQGSVH